MDFLIIKLINNSISFRRVVSHIYLQYLLILCATIYNKLKICNSNLNEEYYCLILIINVFMGIIELLCHRPSWSTFIQNQRLIVFKLDNIPQT